MPLRLPHPFSPMVSRSQSKIFRCHRHRRRNERRFCISLPGQLEPVVLKVSLEELDQSLKAALDDQVIRFQDAKGAVFQERAMELVLSQIAPPSLQKPYRNDSKDDQRPSRVSVATSATGMAPPPV